MKTKPYSANKAKPFVTDFFFLIGTLFMFILKRDLVMYVERLGYEFASMLVHLFVYLIFLHKFTLILPVTHSSSNEGKKS